jgi:hypothetical protein
MEATAAAHVAVDAAAGEAASNRAGAVITAAIWHWATHITRMSVAVTWMSVVAAAIAIHAVVAVSVTAVPGAGANEDAAGKPRRTIVSVGRAGIGIVAVVAISADRSRIPIAVTAINRSADTNADRNLGTGISRGREQQDSE